uniref:Uncharacterized protein n=1 Tax=viral metagenome TaxID=1070528 RepID=A0A6C0KWH4_9ZZZZ
MFILNKQPILKLTKVTNRKTLPSKMKPFTFNASNSEETDFKKLFQERRDVFELTRKTDLKKLHDQLIVISKDEIKFTKNVLDEIVPQDAIDKIKNIFIPNKNKTNTNTKIIEIIPDDYDYFSEETK